MFVVPVSRVSRYAGQCTAQDTRHLSRMLGISLERLFAPETAAATATATAAESVASRSPALDVSETDGAYTVTLEVPGVTKDDLKVSVEGRQVTVQAGAGTSASASTGTSAPPSNEKKDGERVVYRERAAARYARTFMLPVEVDQAEAGAKLEQGVLTLTLPKRGARSAVQIAVN